MIGLLVASIATVLSISAAAFYFYRRNRFLFWKKRNVPTLESHNLLFGDFTDVFLTKTSVGERYKELYDLFGDEPFGGVFFSGRPTLIVKEVDLIKKVLVKNFSNFHGRGMYYDVENHPLSGNLFFLDGPKWRRMRVKLTPTFATGKVKMMFETLWECSNQLNLYLEKEIQKDNVIDMKELLARFSTDVIASVAFGIQCNSIHNPDVEFRTMGRKVFEPTLMLSIRNMSYFFLHFMVKVFKIGPTEPDVGEFMKKVIYDTVNYRETNQISRPDFLNLLIEMRKAKAAENGADTGANGVDPEKDVRPLTMDEIVAQAFVFFIAGYETTSTTTGFCLYELARHKDILKAVQREIDEALKNNNGKVAYELLTQSLPYTDKVVNETLRLYPAVPFLTRESSSPIEFERQPGKPPLKVDKGQLIALSVLGMHMDPKYFPEPEIFDPERFSPENCASRPQYCYIPFGEGPRICIGMRFGLIQVKLALVNILSRYNVEFCSKTPNPMTFDARSVVPFSKGGLYLRLVPRDGLVSTAA